jgi:hypothetical protein
MRRTSLALVLLLVAPLACAQVYKWTDAKGTTHFSEAPPPSGIKYSTVNLAASGGGVASSSSSASSAQSNSQGQTANPAASSSSGQSQTMDDTPENRAKLCSQLHSSITALSGAAPVVEEQNGKQTLLNSDDRKQQLDANQSQYEMYCGH